jgi:hypothetical protein
MICALVPQIAMESGGWRYPRYLRDIFGKYNAWVLDRYVEEAPGRSSLPVEVGPEGYTSEGEGSLPAHIDPVEHSAFPTGGNDIELLPRPFSFSTDIGTTNAPLRVSTHLPSTRPPAPQLDCIFFQE